MASARSIPPRSAALDHAYGLDLPLHEQVLRYVGRLAHGDFGPSLVYRDFSVTDLVAEGLPVSLTLGGLALLLALAIGIAAGLLAAARAGGATDRALMIGDDAAHRACRPSSPGRCWCSVFALGLGWLPVSGWDGGDPAHLLLPVVALALPVGGRDRQARPAPASPTALAQDHVRTARARGLSPVRVLLRPRAAARAGAGGELSRPGGGGDADRARW